MYDTEKRVELVKKRVHSPQSVHLPATWNARIMWNIFSSKESTFAFCALSNLVLSNTHLRQLQAGHALRHALQRIHLLSSFWKNKRSTLTGSCCTETITDLFLSHTK